MNFCVKFFERSMRETSYVARWKLPTRSIFLFKYILAFLCNDVSPVVIERVNTYHDKSRRDGHRITIRTLFKVLQQRVLIIHFLKTNILCFGNEKIGKNQIIFVIIDKSNLKAKLWLHSSMNGHTH